MSVAARVQYHPARAALLPRLLESLAPLPTEVITDPDPDGRRNPWRCYQACLADPPDCTHLLILQDDVVVCRNFPAAVERIADANPDIPVSLFLGGRQFQTVRDARNSRGPYVLLRPHDPLPVVATLWPRQLAVDFLTWAQANPMATGRRDPRSDDAVAGVWKSRTRTSVLCTVPSLVEHPDIEPSLIRAKAGGRTAARFIGDRDPLDVDWSQV